MQIYKAPIKDYQFLIKDFLNSGSLDSVFENSDLNIDDLSMILEEAAKLCEETLLPINQIGDMEGCSFNQGNVKTPKGFKEAYKKFVENGWQGLTVSKKYGGQQLPYFVNMFLDEMD
jgi:Acyl-CoA dehydrogenases